jgi:serine/threonine-protein kinase HipA
VSGPIHPGSGALTLTGYAPTVTVGLVLDVQVLGRKVGTLRRLGDEYVFQYDAGVASEYFVSLAMPVRMQPWVWPRDLHPYFRQNLPEGFLLSVIQEDFGRLLDGTDLSVLAVVGSASIGRVTVTLQGQAVNTPLDEFDVAGVLHGDNTHEHFTDLVRHHARAAISGAVPKFLAPEALVEAGTEAMVQTAAAAPGKTSMRTGRYIVKGSDDKTPYLGFNEFYSMRLIERVGAFPVAKTIMSDDGRVLLVERFDVDEHGVPVRGVEDLCGLLGLPPNEKYSPSTEQVVKAARAYFTSERWSENARRLAWLILSTYVVRNADCHAKNMALMYTDAGDVEFAPAYDMVTTQAYPPHAKNPPALTVDGRRTWAPGNTLSRFFATRLNIPAKEYASMVEALCDAAVDTGKEVIVRADERPEWRGVAKNMVHAWNDGMEALRSIKPDASLRELTSNIDEAKFSEPDKPPTQEKLGRSPLLPKRGGRAF